MSFHAQAFCAVGASLILVSAGGVLQAQEEPPRAQPVEGLTVGEEETRTSVIDRSRGSLMGELDQVSVTGGTPDARVMFRAYVKDLREDFRWSVFKIYQANQPVKNRDAWEIPIRIEIWGDPTDVYRGDDARMKVELRADNRFHIRLAARLHDRFAEEEFRLETVRALLVEQMLTPFVVDPYVLEMEQLVVPEWLVHGFDEMIQHRQTGQQSVFYEGVLRSGMLLSPEELFAEKDPEALDPISYAAFRVSAASMVRALLDQEEGDLGMREFLGDLVLASGGGEFPLLKKHFPAFREMDQGLEKWWTLQVATMGQQQRFEFLDRHETDQWLTEALTFRFDGREKEVEAESKKRRFFDRFRKPKEEPVTEATFVGTIEQFPEFLDRKGVETKLTESFNQIQHLKVFGFPLYRPLLDRYDLVIEKLAAGELNGVSAELEELSRLRATISNTMEQAEDFLNHFEATQSPQRSDVFDDYIRMRREFERRGRPNREDRITRHLDTLEQELR
ncbi:MAG: hypothetical protein AAGF67_07695 [Verrucomicrobiota bacterium]